MLGTDDGQLGPRYGNQVFTRVTGQFLADGPTAAGEGSSARPDQAGWRQGTPDGPSRVSTKALCGASDLSTRVDSSVTSRKAQGSLRQRVMAVSVKAVGGSLISESKEEQVTRCHQTRGAHAKPSAARRPTPHRPRRCAPRPPGSPMTTTPAFVPAQLVGRMGRTRHPRRTRQPAAGRCL